MEKSKLPPSMSCWTGSFHPEKSQGPSSVENGDELKGKNGPIEGLSMKGNAEGAHSGNLGTH